MVTVEEILRIARLAKLLVDDSKIEQLTKDMSEIICFADKINMAVEDDETEFYNMNNTFNVFHEDEIIESFSREEILKNRDGGENGYFVVKRREK